MSEIIHNPDDAEARRQTALFRYGLIADLIHLPRNHKGLYKLLEAKSEQEYSIPSSLRRHVAVETMRGWLTDYRRGGFDALWPRIRADAGSTRSIPTHVVDLLCELKDQSPELSIPMLLKKVRTDHSSIVSSELILPESTVHRLLARRGLTRPRKDEPTSKDHRRFEFDAANELWMSDVMYGPKIKEKNRARQTYLIAFIDDATRLVPYASFTLSEGTVAYLPVLEQAVRRRGLPKRLYVDNGSAFRSRHLALVCAKLGIALIHAKPYTPQGKGKMERWFRTVRMQLLAGMSIEDSASISTLNRRLAAWVEGEYHHAPHRGLAGETPLDRWARLSEHVRLPERDIGESFLAEQARKVQRDRTVTLDGSAFEVDAALVGESVQLRYDPATSPDKRTVEVWHRGQRIERARRVDVLANCSVKRNGPTRNLEFSRSQPQVVPEGLPMRTLDNEEGIF